MNTREQFTAIMNSRFTEPLTQLGGLLWQPEEGVERQFFIAVPPVSFSDGERRRFWQWANSTLSDRPVCYYCDPDNSEEWWGVMTEEDAVLFILRWA